MIFQERRIRPVMEWRLRSLSLQLGARTLVMGVVNITPDSFSDGGLYFDAGRAVEHGLRLLDEGAAMIDLGAESTRPGSRAGFGDRTAVSAEEEQARLLPVLAGILQSRPGAVISVDTYKAATARAAIDAGAEIVNDVSGLHWDPQMAEICAELRCGVVLMHTRGRPEEWKTQAGLAQDDVLPLVREGLMGSLDAARAAGIAEESVVLDPGYGFGKRFDENYVLLAHQAELLALGRPLLAGVSRKSFLARTLANASLGVGENNDVVPSSRESASIAALVAAVLNGAAIVRVHTVRQAVEAAAIADAILAAS